jgi:nucleoside-diphosphate-sugar epimerase
MRVAISGANGYIGSYLACYLLKQGCEVIAISRKFSTIIEQQLQGATFITADVLTDGFENMAISCDTFIHAASSNDILSKDFKKGVDLSVYGTKNALNLCIKNGIKNFVFFSTIQVLGTELKGTYTDESKAVIESNYAFNHLMAEEYLKFFVTKNNINGLIIRPANIYGAMLDTSIDRWTLVPNCFCKEAVEKGTITLLSSGKQNRSFLSLENICRGTYNAIIKFKDEKLKTLNFANTKNYTIVQLAKWTKEVLEQELKISVNLLIKSNQPAAGNEFTIDISSLHNNNIFLEETEASFKNEVIKIIHSLKAKTNESG